MVAPKKQDFWPKINILKGNHFILRIRGAPVRQKLGMILENKVVQKLTLKVQFLHFLTNCHSSTDFFPSSILILGQKSCFLGLTIFKIPQPN